MKFLFLISMALLFLALVVAATWSGKDDSARMLLVIAHVYIAAAWGVIK